MLQIGEVAQFFVMNNWWWHHSRTAD